MIAIHPAQVELRRALRVLGSLLDLRGVRFPPPRGERPFSTLTPEQVRVFGLPDRPTS